MYKKIINILITDGQWRKALATVRALGKKGYNISIIGYSYFTTSFFSKYCNERIIFSSKSNYIENLINTLKKKKIDILIPMEDYTIDLCLKNRKEIEKYTILPLANKNLIDIFMDKSKTYEIASNYNIPHPKTFIFNSIEHLKQSLNNLPIPLIIKPRKSSGSRGLVKIFKREDIFCNYLKIHKKYPFPIIQELIPNGGRTRGVSILLDPNQNLVAYFVHERIREYPIDGGPSTLRKSVRDPNLVEISYNFLKNLKWEGFAMLEFKEDPRDNKFKLIEVNPRFVGSLQLAISSGVDFPNLLVDVFLFKKYKKVTNYKENIYCRWLLPGDILHFLKNPDRFSLNPSFFKFFDKNLYYDIISVDDPLPIFGRIIVMIFEAFKISSWKKYILKKE